MLPQSPAAAQMSLELRPRSADADVPGPRQPRVKYIRVNGEKLDVFAVARGEAILEGKLTFGDLFECGIPVKVVNSIALYVYGREDGEIPEPPAGFWV